MAGKGEVVSFETLIALVRAAHPETYCDVVLVIDCCLSSQAIVAYNALEIKPERLSIICSTNVELGITKFFPKQGQSAFCAAFCVLCSRMHKIFPTRFPAMKKLMLEVSHEAAKLNALYAAKTLPHVEPPSGIVQQSLSAFMNTFITVDSLANRCCRSYTVGQ